MTAGLAFTSSPPPIALEPLLAFPIRDPAFAGAAGPGPGLNQSPIYHVGGYRSLVVNFDGIQNPAPGSPVTFTFSQGWPSDSLPGSGAGPGTMRPVWAHVALVPPIAFRYWLACRIPVVAPLFTYTLDSFVLSTSGTQQVTTMTIHGTDTPCSEVQPLDTPIVATVNGTPLNNRRWFNLVGGGLVVPGGGSIDIAAGTRRWYVGRSYISWFTNAAANTANLSVGPGGQVIQWRGPASIWQTDEVEIPSDMTALTVGGPAGTLIQGGIGIGTLPIP